ncbi:cobaltochelatase subunit CobN [Azorhizobium oxalatiphilum]|uniref:Cobaltochelatase subunit CobN n=1 Tax=Azorhizobium oxalatiphilum TaxID=980631 RepID=A0A917BHP6_9HYPH|nr:cobaltochelatase subunit CobN [Azorhizobium oxalatiphilum]GGF46153.1 cobaltochelatase subunit CobN [Azorhizobium oxalatiphilum]
MHILATTSASIEDLAEPIDLRLPPADVLALSFTDSDLLALAAAWRLERDTLPALRLARLKDLRHPMSVDLWIDRTARQAKVIVVRLLGGLDWWRYGAEQLSALARRQGIALALLPGEDQDDPRLAALSTVAPDELAALLACFRQGGPVNMGALLKRTARLAGRDAGMPAPAAPVPQAAFYQPGTGMVGLDAVLSQSGTASGTDGNTAGSNPVRIAATDEIAVRSVSQPAVSTPVPFRSPNLPPLPLAGEGWGGGTAGHTSHAAPTRQPPATGTPPRALLLFYRSMWLAGDIAPIDALADALAARGIAPVPLFVASLKEPASRAFVRQAIADTAPDIILTATAFAAGEADDVFAPGGPPVLQVVPATTARQAWETNARGLAAADLAMHVVLPELDGRVLAGAISFKTLSDSDDDLAFASAHNAPYADGIAHAADKAAALIRLARTPRAERRLMIVMPDYPGVPGRTGYAVGLDVPESTRRLLATLRSEGYAVDAPPEDARALLEALTAGGEAVRYPLDAYKARLATLPPETQAAIHAAWGPPEADADLARNAFAFRAASFGKAVVALAPERGASLDRRADYHDPTLPPRHALLAFGFWLRESLDAHALIHMGAHGTLEWLPGKTVALTPACFPQALLGELPIIYPFIVSNPGEAAQAKRRVAALTLGHLPPPLAHAGLSEAEQRLEQLVDEYAQADGLDRRRRERLARLIVETAADTGLATVAGVAADDDADTALRQIDAWLCDVKDLAVKDGLHIYGSSEDGDDMRRQSGEAERTALLAALDGRHIPAGPAGAPARGRRDVLPTGRNLFTADPRAIPTPTALDLGRLAADEVVRAFLQEHGDYPHALVIDLWGSATLRTGGEEIAQGLSLMGCRPQWDAGTGRVTGIEVLPPAALGRPRVDVTWRISGLFRDIFPAQVALIDAATRAVAARADEGTDNPLAASGETDRIFGAAPGAYGAGIEERLARGLFEERSELGQSYLDHASHAYGGADGAARPAPGAFATQVARADGLLHGTDDPARDLLDGGEDAAFIGGFAAAAEKLGKAVDLIVLDTTDPARPKARDLATALARIVHGRVSDTFIAGQMRHGPRGASELLETVDRLIAFAETTGRVADGLIDALHAAYLRDEAVRAFLLAQNPAAAAQMARRFSDARRRGLWHPRRNDIDADLDALRREAVPCPAAE